jgi:hypothetical protein
MLLSVRSRPAHDVSSYMAVQQREMVLPSCLSWALPDFLPTISSVYLWRFSLGKANYP